METQRTWYLLGLIALSFMILMAWGDDQRAAAAAKQRAEQQAVSGPALQTAGTDADSGTVTIKTDVLELRVSLHGGDIIEAKLLKYPKTTEDSSPFELLRRSGDFSFTAPSGLMGKGGIDVVKDGKSSRPLYQASAKSFVLKDGQDSITVPLTFDAGNGITYTKFFELSRGSYRISTGYTVKNGSSADTSVYMYGGLRQNVLLPEGEGEGSSFYVAGSYRGAAYSSDDEKYEKLPFDKFDGDSLSISSKGGWVSMLQHYFVTAWISGEKEPITITSDYEKLSRTDDGVSGIYVVYPETTVKAGSEGQVKASLWIGPKLKNELAEAAPYLDRTLDYGWLWFISEFLVWLMNIIHSAVMNWGIAIICITLIVRLAMFKLTKAQYVSFAKMRLVAPKLKELQERYKDNKEELQKQMMELYRKEHVNPLGGCFPILIQMPIFIALYWALMESVELRQAPFVLWIQDLSIYDPYFILPIIYGVSLLLIQKMTPTPVTDPMQKKIMMAMPVVFTLMFCTFPAGLTLYWCVSNIFTIVQQKVIYSQLEKMGLQQRTPKKPKQK